MNLRVAFDNLASEYRVVGQEAAHNMHFTNEDVLPHRVVNQRSRTGDISVLTVKNEEHSDGGCASTDRLFKYLATVGIIEVDKLLRMVREADADAERQIIPGCGFLVHRVDEIH